MQKDMDFLPVTRAQLMIRLHITRAAYPMKLAPSGKMYGSSRRHIELGFVQKVCNKAPNQSLWHGRPRFLLPRFVRPIAFHSGHLAAAIVARFSGCAVLPQTAASVDYYTGSTVLV